MSMHFVVEKKQEQFSVVENLNSDIIIRVKIGNTLMSTGKGVAKQTVVCPFNRLMEI